MVKYTKKTKEPMVIQPVRFEQRAIDEVAEIHGNFSEFVRDAVDKLITEQQKVLNGEVV